MKKIITILITLLFLSLHTIIYADDTVYTEGFLKYQIGDDGIIIVDYFGVEEEVVIPTFIGFDENNHELYVVEIAPGTFDNNSYVKKVLVPESVIDYNSSEIDGINVQVYDSYGNIVDKQENIPDEGNIQDKPIINPPIINEEHNDLIITEDDSGLEQVDSSLTFEEEDLSDIINLENQIVEENQEVVVQDDQTNNEIIDVDIDDHSNNRNIYLLVTTSVILIIIISYYLYKKRKK